MDLLRSKLNKQEVEARLSNWGRWNRQRINPQSYTTWQQLYSFFFGAAAWRVAADIDAQHLEDVITTLDLASRSGLFKWPRLYCFVLKLEYAERPESKQRPASERAKDVSRKFKRPCAESTYYQILARSKQMLFTFADPL